MTDRILATMRIQNSAIWSGDLQSVRINGKDYTAAQVAAALDAITPEPPFVLGDPVALKDCPIGLFMKGETLALKSEYGNNEGRIDAYIVESGEFFWGDQPQTIASQRAQMVRPVEITPTALATITPEPDPLDDEDVLAIWGLITKGADDYSSLALKIVQTLRERWKAEPVSEAMVR